MRCSFDDKQLTLIFKALSNYYDSEYQTLKSQNSSDREWQNLEDLKVIMDTIDSYLSYNS